MVGAKNFVLSLPDEIREQLDNRIRKMAYGRSSDIAAWLQEMGIKTSRTAVARYEKVLKEKDGITDAAGSLGATVKSVVPGGELAMLFQELGELEYRRAELLDQIRDLME
ncbi:DUF3486 family protein [Vibrio cholerae]|uniref:phage protein Gp27 family protein n=1 Tax=Vibrio paracholerae TaxID=650003 RepID=UPI001EC1AAD9|nr:phage protein Gp27 family protein [Vibrio paracholerae]EGR0523015.1 DUF3486 family protein [Vibrio cholerae]EGR0598199.1 DUF3486 family protein [Vibrio cholerae]MCO7024848.1 DUF3486 family protein [Vibrio paracholerae]